MGSAEAGRVGHRPGTTRSPADLAESSRITATAAALVASAGMLAAFLAVWFATRREPWLDEYYTALLANMSFGDMARYIAGDAHPPLYYVVIGLWRRVFGDSPVALRAFSTITHLAGGAVFFHVLRTALGRTSLAAPGAALFLLSPGLLFHAAEARMYSLGVLLVATALLLAWRQLAGTARSGEAVALGAVSAAAFYTHYMTVFPVGVIFLFWAGVVLQRRAGWRPLAAGAASGALLVLPWVPVVLRQMAGKRELTQSLQASWTDPSALTWFPAGAPDIQLPNPVTTFAENGASLLGVYPAAGLPITALLAIPFVIVLGLAALRMLRGDARGLLVMLAAGANMAGCMLVGIFDRRYLLWLVPFLVLFLCLGLLESERRWPRAVRAVLAGTLMLLTTAGAVRVARSGGYGRIAPLVETIRTGYQANDLVIFSALYGQVAFDYHARRADFEPERRGFPETIYDWWERQPMKGWGGPVIRTADLEAFLNRLRQEDRSRIWLVEFEADHFDPHGRLHEAFRQRGWSVSDCSAGLPGARPYALFLITRDGPGECGGLSRPAASMQEGPGPIADPAPSRIAVSDRSDPSS